MFCKNCLTYIFQSIESSGKVAIQLIGYSNPSDLDQRGACCNGNPVLMPNGTLCSRACNTLITLCLDTFRSPMDFEYCPFGRRNLSAINDRSSIIFSVPTAGDVENPVLFPFNNNYQVKITHSELNTCINYITYIFFFKEKRISTQSRHLQRVNRSAQSDRLYTHRLSNTRALSTVG